MKASFLLSFVMLFIANGAGAAEGPTPVMNAVSFTGEYVTFREAKPKFRPVHQAQPVYPQELLSKRVEGFAIVAFLVDLDGTTTQCQVVEASDVAFGESARAAIQQWQFSPPQFSGKPGRIAMTLPVEFTVPAQVALQETAPATRQAGS